MPDKPICKVDDCSKHIHDSGFCSMHAARFRKHGDPLKGAKPVRGKCTVDGCDRPQYGNGLCSMHHQRFKKHGDPLGGRNYQKGEIAAFVQSAISTDLDECIQFPYCRDKFGYGRFNPGVRTVGAHCYVAEQVYGPKPTASHECCHSCGNGHLGCINPKHLYWGTRADNVRDTISHGTANFFGRA